MGGEAPEVGRGGLVRVWMTAVPVSDLDRAVEFYCKVLGLQVQLDSRDNNWVELGPEEPLGKVALYVPSVHDRRKPGGPTGIVFSTDSVYDLHRRLVDEGVRFRLKPERQTWGGLMAVFLDEDGNELTVVEDPEHYTKVTPSRL